MEQVETKPDTIEEQARDAIEQAKQGIRPKVIWEVSEFLRELGEDFALDVV